LRIPQEVMVVLEINHGGVDREARRWLHRRDTEPTDFLPTAKAAGF
jgi:hypothetical protein